MAIPTDRDSFKDFILRKLGFPAINIELSDEQIDDRIDEALDYWATFSFDGKDKTYYSYKLTSDDFTNKYITMPDNIIGAVRIFDLSSAFGRGDIFNVQYQLAMSDIWNIAATNMVPFYMAMQNIQFVQQILVGQQPIRYTKHVNRVYLDMDMSRLNVGDFIVVEAYYSVDPEEFPKVWSDHWLQRYTTALVKKNWGEVLSKFEGVPIIGGMKMNGIAIMQEAQAQIDHLEDLMRTTYSLPPELFWG